MHLLHSCISLLIIVLFPLARTYMCPEPDVCKCESILLTCNCHQRQNISLNEVFHFEISDVEVKGCGRVVLSMGLSHLPLKHLDLLDIDELHVRPFVLTGIQGLVSLRMVNISRLDIQRNGFSLVSNVTRIEMRNVTAERLQKGTFEGLSNLGSFIISDSVFGTVEPLAIVFTNVSSFEVTNTKFGVFENMSLMINGGDTASFNECSFSRTGNRSFNLSYMGNLNINNCQFGTISTETIQTRNLKNFSFTNSSVDEVECDAFTYLDITDSFIFTGNTIKMAGSKSLFSRLESYAGVHRVNLTINLGNNELTCDCDLSWLWAHGSEFYSVLFNTSTCIGSPNTSLSAMVPVFTDSGECVKLDFKHTSVNPTNMTTTSVNSMQSRDGDYNSLVGTKTSDANTNFASGVSEFSFTLLLGCYLINVIFNGAQYRRGIVNQILVC